MSIKPSSLLKLTVAGAVLLSVGACKAADKGQGALKSESFSALNLSKSEASVFSKYFATDPCDVDEMEALGALAGLGMGESGANGLSFKSRAVNEDNVTFENLTLRADGSEDVAFSAGSAVFHCPKMGDEAPNFNRLDLTSVFIKDERDNVEFTAETLNIANPTAQAARAVVESMTRPSANAVSGVGFGAISITGAEIKSAELKGTLAALSWGEIRNKTGQGKADLTIDDVNLVIPGKNGAQDMTLDFDGMSARNLNIGSTVAAGPSDLSSTAMIGTVLESLNNFEKPYDQLIVETLKVNSQGFDVNFGGIEGQTSEDGALIKTRQSLKPSEITLKPALAEMRQFRDYYELLKSLGMETINFSGNTVSTLNSADDSIAVTDGLLVMDDIFRLNFEYEAEGLNAMLKALQDDQDTQNPANALAAYEPLKLRDFRLTLEDNSIVEKGLVVATQMTGQSEKDLKRALVGAVFAAAFAAENEFQAEVYTTGIQAFADFIKNGGTLTIEANPPEPFPLAPFITGKSKGEGINPDSLGFSASQEDGAE